MMKITVVTVCYNVEKEIEKTMLSVINQSYQNIEYIIIDGASTDNTYKIAKDVASCYPDRKIIIVSEPDNGIYDAMNKGLDRSSGEWIAFLNAGDYYYSKDSIEKLFCQINKNTEIVYGLVINAYQYGKFVMMPAPIDTIKKSMPFGHPATFVLTSILKKYRFNCKYRIAADYDLFFRLYCNKHIFQFVNTLMTIFEAEDGLSNRRWAETRKESCLVNNTYGTFKYWRSFIYMWIIMQIKQVGTILFPSFMRQWDMSSKKRKTYYLTLEDYAKKKN